MKGIILAGGFGTRLYPLTKAISKQLLPIYDKPTIYYPLSTLMMAGIRNILIISTRQDTPRFKQLLGNGSFLGCRFEYAVQDKPRGLAEAYIIGEKFIGKDKVAMILGDNLFYGKDIEEQLKKCVDVEGAIGFAARVKDPSKYGVYEFDKNMKVISIEEKPKYPKSNYANSGLYFCDNRVIDIAKKVKPSSRGELEITSVLDAYLKMGELKVEFLDRGTAWLDTGTFESMMQASLFVQVVQERQGVSIGCIEEVAYNKGYINKNKLLKLADKLSKSGYGDYLKNLIKQ